MTFGEKFKKRRIEMGLTQESFAEKFNELYYYSFTKSTISNYENNLRTPEINVLTKLATFMSISIDYLLGIEKNNDDINLDAIEYALFTEVKELSPEMKEQIINYARFLKNQSKGRCDYE